jgi:hypothetical protein
MKKFAAALFDFFSSIKLAVPLILSLAVMLAVGTFYEAAHGTPEAQRVIYKSWFMSVEMFLLIVNVVCAAIDRLPWKKHHVGFVITHAGIVILLMGSFITQQRGVDGALALGVGESSDSFMVESEQQLHVYQSLDGKPFALLFQKDVDFAKHPPTDNAYTFGLVDDEKMKVVDFLPHAVRKVHIESSSNPKDLPAMHFSLKNDRVAVAEWVGLNPAVQPFYDMGPASISIIRGPLPKPPQPHNQIVIYQETENSGFKYAIFSMRQMLPTKMGTLHQGEAIDTGWGGMGLKFTADKIEPHAAVTVNYAGFESTPENQGINPAVQIQVGNNKSWFELDMPHEIKGPQNTYFVDFARKRYELGFELDLKKFKMGTYGGSMLPASYASTVDVNKGNKDIVISMNEPLKYNNYTLYQQSYETNERGEPVVSVFAVNYDPGRAMKYFGSICIVGGIAIMFYLKPKWNRKKKVQA